MANSRRSQGVSMTPALMERLEDRLLLSTTWTGTYPDGSPLTVKLSGPGTLVVTGGVNSAIDTITVNSGSPKDVLTISAKTRTKGELIQVNKISVTGDIKAIVGPQVDLIGDVAHLGVFSSDWVGKLSLHTVGNSVNVLIGPAGTKLDKPISVAFGGDFLNATMTLSSPLVSLKANSFTGSLTTETDVKSIKVAQSMIANMTIMGSIGSIKVGDVAGGTWTAAGDIGKLTMGGASTNLRLSTTFDIASVKIHGDGSFYSIHARNLGTLAIGGNMQMQSGLTLTGESPDKVCLKKFTVGGWWRGGTLRAYGSVGEIVMGGLYAARIYAGVDPGFINYDGTADAASILQTVGGVQSTAVIKKVIVKGNRANPDDSSYQYSTRMLNLVAASLPMVKLAKPEFALMPEHAIMALNLGKITATGIDGTPYKYGTNWPAGGLLVLPLT